jgi:hypothetical protein
MAAATPDAVHQGIKHLERAHRHASFVDDTATAHTRADIYDAVNPSVLGVSPFLWRVTDLILPGSLLSRIAHHPLPSSAE